MPSPDFAAIDEAMRIAQSPMAPHPQRPPHVAIRGYDEMRKAEKHHAKSGHVPGIKFDGGLIATDGHGRTDDVPLDVPSGSFVLPADIVSAIGQGNTFAGARAIQEVTADAPYHADAGAYGSGEMPIKHGGGPGGPPAIPAAPPPYPNAGKPGGMMAEPRYASGGKVAGRPVHTEAAGLMIVAGGQSPRVLFIRRSARGAAGGLWAFPGGHIEPGETPMQAAVRETDEETGFDLNSAAIPWTHRVSDGVSFTTFAAAIDAPFRPMLNREHTDWRWAPPKAPPRPLHPGCDVALRKLAGEDLSNPQRVPIIAAGGEFVLTPDEVRWFGDGDLERGYRWLEQFVVGTRRHLRRTLGKLKPPKND